MESEKELLPCPFCSALWVEVFGPETDPPLAAGHRAHCQGCGAKSATWETRSQAVKAWNLRSDKVAEAIAAEREKAAQIADAKVKALRRACQLMKSPDDHALRISELAIASMEDVAAAIRSQPNDPTTK